MFLKGKKRRNSKPFTVSAVWWNDSVNIIDAACSCCYHITKQKSYEEKKEYIEKRVLAGHTSILEHGIIILFLRNVPSKYNDDLITLLSLGRYIQAHVVSTDEESNTKSICISGSIRAYSDLYRKLGVYNKDYYNNPIFRYILFELMSSSVKEEWADLIRDDMVFANIASEIGFTTYVLPMGYDNYDLNGEYVVKEYNLTKDKSIKVHDEIQLINIARMTRKYPELRKREVLDMIPVTIEFKNMSRTATHQLVRHRNAITQESQRYTNSSNAGFYVPSSVSDKTFNIETMFGNFKDVSLSDIGYDMIKIYDQLIRAGVKKEDARSILCNNTECGSLFMTFTCGSLRKFLELRTDPHAQEEIRLYANKVKEVTSLLFTYCDRKDIDIEKKEVRYHGYNDDDE